ncbi:hypothetical protein P2R64_00185 [Priestia megaterium]|uniref:hypothetical protein n=1 Tax=Priestia megaterium TaxID=1404 RepID=UPI0021C03136|nr:hypothetical protein [Priestia megaterium]MCT9858231.1 hypothetical protein [Priestia megaterium]MDF1958478.1 hypothetical protein [Priestia megaterium]
MKNRVAEAILVAISGALVTFLISLMTTYFLDNNAIVRIGESTKVEENQFVLPIDVSTFKSEVKELRIGTPIALKEDQIKSNQPLEVKVVKNTIKTANGSIYEIAKIPSDKDIQLVLISNERLDEQDLEINSKGNNFDVEYVSQTESPVKNQLITLITNAVLYALFAGIITYWAHTTLDRRIGESRNSLQEHKDRATEEIKRMERIHEASDKEQARLNGLLDDLNNDLEKVRERLDKVTTDARKRHILLQARLNDYRKELSFWRDTVRKSLYQLYNGEEKASELFKIVSKSLKTYQTHEKNDHDFETIKVLSKMINDIDKDKE